MIASAVKLLVDELNEFINLKLGGTEPDKVVLTHIVSDTGTILVDTDKVACTLVNIEEERIGKAQSPYQPSSGGTIERMNPEIKLNLYLLFASNPRIEPTINNYEQGLLLLSYVIGFFQSKNLFNHQNSPALAEKIDKLIVDLYSIPIEQQNYLWGALGAKYLPSVVYRVRLLSIQEELLLDSGQPIQGLEQNLSPSNT